MLNWLKHAFASETSTTAVPTVSQAETIDRVCREIARRQMTLPAQLLFESSLPLHFLAGQMLRFVEPFLAILLDPAEIRDFAAFLEQRGSVEYICRRLDAGQVLDSQRLPPLQSSDRPRADAEQTRSL